MIALKPLHIILIGIALMVTGWVLPMLMVLRILQSTFALNFITYAFQVAGFFLGIIGVSMHVRLTKK
jgi:hypothetical protein